MTDYDNTNTGAAFPPYPDHEMILSGKINDNGKEMEVVICSRVNKDGTKRYEVYEKVGAMFVNDTKGNDKAPHFAGPLGLMRRIAAWRKEKDGKAYMSFSVSDKETQNQKQSTVGTMQPVGQALPNDNIPF